MITILGPTASGKTQLAVHLAAKCSGEIISADSRQVYVGMDLGTGKDLKEYSLNGKNTPYHLIDIKQAGYEYNVFEFQQDFLKSYQQIESKGNTPIFCGGTGLYLSAVLNRYDLQEVPQNEKLREDLKEKPSEELVEMLKSMTSLHNQTDITERERLIRALEIQIYRKENPHNKIFPEIKNTCFGILFERNLLRERITQRLSQRLQDGMIEEVENLLSQGIKSEKLLFYGLEYKYVTLFLQKEISYEQMFTLLNTAIHQFAKRQMTWFRRMERQGLKINWIEGTLPLEGKLQQIMLHLKQDHNFKSL